MSNFNTKIINLDKDVERKKSIEEQFSGQNIKFNFIKGVYGKNIKRKGLQHLCTDGQIGCFASHYKIWKEIKIQHLKYTLVCEDDIIIPDNFMGKVSDILNKYDSDKNKKDWEIITFHKNMNIYPFNKFITSCCYLINGNCIDKLLKLHLYGHIDLSINFSKIKVDYEDIGIKLLDIDSNNCNSLSNTFGWYITMPWFYIPGADLVMNTKSFLILSLILFVIFLKPLINLVFFIIVFTLFYILHK